MFNRIRKNSEEPQRAQPRCTPDVFARIKVFRLQY